MLVEEVAAIYRRMIGTNDASVVSPAEMVLDLEMAHERYRDIVFRMNPMLLVSAVTFRLDGGSTSIDMESGFTPSSPLVLVDHVIVGPTANLTQARLTSIVEIFGYDSDNGVPIYPAYKNLTGQPPGVFDTETRGYAFAGRTVITFTEGYDGAHFVMYYRGQGAKQTVGVDQDPEGVDWNLYSAGDGEDIDTFHWFHDIIAMLAAKHHDIVRWEANGVREEQLQNRIREFRSHLRRFGGPSCGWSTPLVERGDDL